MNIKKKMLLSIFVIFLGVIAIYIYNKKKTENPNIIFITIDALRADHMSLYGYKYKTSPNIDKFAENAVVFNRAFCTIPKTSASVASIFTGLHPFVHGSRPNLSVLKPKLLTLAEALKTKDYFNYGITANGNLSKKFKFNQGFDRYEEAWSKFYGPDESGEFITEQILKFLKKSHNEKKKKPFFLWGHYIDTHTPYIPPAEFIEPREPGRDILKIEKRIVSGQKHERKELRKNSNEGHFISLYDGEIKYVDHLIGKILKLFKELEFDSNTILIISSDHGEDLGEKNYFFDHGMLTFEAGIRVPLIVYIPNKKNQVINYNVSMMDIFPTILNKLDIKFPSYSIQGRDLFKNNPNRLFYIFGLRSSCIVSGDYHYTEVEDHYASRLGIETDYMFHIDNGQFSLKNIVASKKPLFTKLKKQYKKYFSRYGYMTKKHKQKKIKLSAQERKNLETLGYL